jgi:hypothetical protein
MWILLVWSLVNTQPTPYGTLLMTSQAECEAVSRMLDSRAIETATSLRSECVFSRILTPNT